MGYGVVWFKRDLRLHDHAPLAAAAVQGPVLALHCLEPSLWAQSDASAGHLGFLRECLVDLRRALARRGVPLQVVRGEAVEVLEAIHAREPFDTLWSHEEIGVEATWSRDKAVHAWCRARGVRWQEFPNGGVVRRLTDRDRWHGIWEQRMGQPQTVLPDLVPGGPLLPDSEDCGIAVPVHDPWEPPGRQRGGRSVAVPLLQAFLASGANGYRRGMSSPATAPEACSRLSPYLTYGCLGVREVVQAVRRQRARDREGGLRPNRDLEAFESRLHWQAHFMQKLEREPAIAHANMHRGYDGLRDRDGNPEHLEALMAGQTGWPMVDASVAMLRHTGWINFRMRAMLVSVATYPLWLDWHPVGLWLARLFVDYEPGIHWSQIQMQAGTTGINLPRVYNPIKQARDHDPEGHFVRSWLPALRTVPDPWIFEPWRMPDTLRTSAAELGEPSWPQPLVDLPAATREAKARVFAWRALPEVREGKAAVILKHASRAPKAARPRMRRRLPPQPRKPDQLGLDFGETPRP